MRGTPVETDTLAGSSGRTPEAQPARWGSRRRVLDALDRLHASRASVRAYELGLATRSHLRRRRHEPLDGLPLPPARLRAQVGPRHADAEFFLRSGVEQADIVRRLVAEAGRPVETLDAIVDWGCGCGRILRHWRDMSATRVAGCDINPVMVKWCVENIRFADFTVNRLAPPLAYQDASFDLIYAFSVMTHLNEELQQAWVQECLRVLRPGGFFLFSTMGEHYLGLGRLTEPERKTFSAGNPVVLYARSPGTSLCSVYHPPEYVRNVLAADFDFVSFRPAIDYGRHDVHLFRKP